MISIEIMHGNRFVKQDDIYRAEAAALEILGEVNHAAAYAEYLHQFETLGGEEGMTGLAALWLEAIAAANLALTLGWHKPDGATCTVTA
jgi:hypothetical protein